MASTNQARAAASAGEREQELMRQVQRLRAQVRTLRARLAARDEAELPELPPANADGNFPALETVQVLLARKVIARRREAGLTRQELAARAGVRVETLAQVEAGGGSPGAATLAKIERALQRGAGPGRRAGKKAR